MIRIIAKSTTKDFWVFHPPAEFPLLDWFNMVKQITQNTPNDVKETCGNASVIGNDRVIFNIKGNDCRLITEIDYEYLMIFIICIGTHKECDKVDVKTIKYNG